MGYYVDEQSLREIIELVGKTAAAACISSFLSEVVLKAAVNARPTKIVVENGIPAALYTIGEKDGPRAVFVSSRRSKVDWKPVLFFGAVFAGCKYILDYREKNVANVR
ncbi:MAG: hypothetical protein J6A37_11740 [Oscillospiraceae bacterium]|nr:hypothetical protein [Oscillospiraceae bacterium]